MMEVGEAISRIMKVCGATKSTSSKVSGNFCGNRFETVYFMMRRKLLHRMKEVCGVTRRMMDELIVEEHQVDRTRLLIYIYIYIYTNFFAILVSQVRCYCNLYLLSFIVTMYWTKFLYEL